MDKLSGEERHKLGRLAARKLTGQGISVYIGDDRWIHACYDIMREMIENDISLDEVEG